MIHIGNIFEGAKVRFLKHIKKDMMHPFKPGEGFQPIVYPVNDIF